MIRHFTWLGCLPFFAAACAHPAASRTPEMGMTTTTAQPTNQTAVNTDKQRVHVSDDLMKACNIIVDNPTEAPKFDFDDSTLLPQDRSVLQQLAKCVTTGPLRDRSIKLVGHADPRGTDQYNMVLGEHRANAVERYLTSLGVADKRLRETSRGDLDAQGHDDAGWRVDRRVDIDMIQ